MANGGVEIPRLPTEAKARVMSSSRTSLVPSTIDGKVEMVPVIPNLRAMSAIVEKPSLAPICALIVLIDRAKASRSVTGPAKARVELRGRQPSMSIGSSTIVSVGFIPLSSAAR